MPRQVAGIILIKLRRVVMAIPNLNSYVVYYRHNDCGLNAKISDWTGENRMGLAQDDRIERLRQNP